MSGVDWMGQFIRTVPCCLAAIQDDEAEVGSVRIDDGHEQVGRNRHQTVRSEPYP